jgi:hypothetical protein
MVRLSCTDNRYRPTKTLSSCHSNLLFCEFCHPMHRIILTRSSFQQTTIKQDATKLLNSSDTLHHELSRLAANLDIKLTALEMILVERHKSSGTTTSSVKHLQQYVRTAATVVTSTSTVMGDEMIDQSQETWDFTSELGWLVNDSVIHGDLTWTG